jgi:hypothetical protein
MNSEIILLKCNTRFIHDPKNNFPPVLGSEKRNFWEAKTNYGYTVQFLSLIT